MSEKRKTVVITGASSGIGRACLSLMSSAGWLVFGTVRKASDRARLRSENVYPVIMDVQDATTVSAAAEEVASRLDGIALDGLVNVAGIGKVRTAEYTL